jgi:hypothetical protein
MSARKFNQVEVTVTVEITAVEFRRLNSFEWMVLSLLNTFPEDTPTIAYATAELCIGEPAFLAAALENLCSVKAMQPKAKEPRLLDLNDYELSENGRAILREGGWENDYGENVTEDIALDWPSLRFHSPTNRSGRDERKQGGPSPDEIQEKLTQQKVEEWLNRNDLRCLRVRKFYVTRVET